MKSGSNHQSKQFVVVLMACALLSATSAAQVTVMSWANRPAPDNDWNNPDNWNPGQVPDADTEAAYNPPGQMDASCSLNLSPGIAWLTIDNASALFWLNQYTLTLYEPEGFQNRGLVNVTHHPPAVALKIP